jgi:hypothetical protein
MKIGCTFIQIGVSSKQETGFSLNDKPNNPDDVSKIYLAWHPFYQPVNITRPILFMEKT